MRALNLAILGLALAAGSCATARRPVRGGPEGTRIRDIGGFARIEGEYQRRKSGAGDASGFMEMTEVVGVDARGSVYDPRLVDLSAAVAMGISQSREIGGAGRSGGTTFPSYALRMAFLREHPVSLSLDGTRSEMSSVASASDVFENRTETLGGTLRARGRHVRGSLRHERSDGTLLGYFQDRRTRRETTYLEMAHEPRTEFATRLSAEIERLEEEPDERRLDTDRVTLTNRYWYGQRGGQPLVSFDTRAEYWNRQENGTTQRRDLSETIGWRVTEDLVSATYASRIETVSEQDRSLRQTLRQRFQHDLYESLVSTVVLERQSDTFEQGSVKRRAASAALAYDKNVPFGRLLVQLGGARGVQENDVNAGTVSVLEEAHAIGTGFLALLRNADVIRTSIVVADSSGSTRYRRGVDYDVDRRGRRTALRRLPGGIIPDGSTVLVDYLYTPPGESVVHTERESLLGSLEILSMLTIYGSVDRTRQTAEDDADSTDAEDSTAGEVGMEARWRGAYLKAFRRDHQSDFGSYLQQFAEARYGRGLGNGLAASISAGWDRTRHDEGGTRTTQSLGGDLRAKLGDHFTAQFGPSFRRDRGQGDDQDRVDLRLSMRYSPGELSIQFDITHVIRELSGSHFEDTRATLAVERRW